MLQNSFETILPIIYLGIATFTTLMYGTVYNKKQEETTEKREGGSGRTDINNKEQEGKKQTEKGEKKNKEWPIITKSIGYLAIQSLIITLILSINNGKNVITSAVVLNNVLIVDELTTFVGTLVIIGAITSIIIAFSYIKNQYMAARINEYMVLTMFSTLSMLLLVSSFDLISMYLAIELQSLSFYVLAAYQRNNEYSTEAGLKYFVLGALASGILLFGESIVYGFTGLTNFEELAKLANAITIGGASEITKEGYITWIGTSVGVIFILIAFLFKISAVPFHLWSPDVYEGAPTTVTAYFSITPKIAAVGIILRLCMFTFYDLIEAWEYLIITCALASMIIGTLGAINQKKIKRLLAYSSIAHVGYILIGLAAGTIESIEALLIYTALYMLTVIGTFSIILVMARENFNINETNETATTKEWMTKETEKGGREQDLIIQYEHTNWWSSTERKEKREERMGGTTPQLPEDKINLRYKKQEDEQGKKQTKISETSLRQGNPISIENRTTGTGIKGTQQKIGTGSTEGENKKTYIKHITDLSTLAKTNPTLAMTAALLFFSNAGIPPLAGFYGKFNVFLTAIENEMYLIAITGILCSVIGTFYSIRIVKIIYYHSMATKTWKYYQPISKENAIILAITILITCFFCISPSFLFITAHSAAISLCI